MAYSEILPQGMLSSTDRGEGSGFFIGGVEIPAAGFGETDIFGNPYEFDRHGNRKPIVEQQVTLIHEPKSMTPPEIEQSIYDQALSEAKIIKLEEAAAAGEVFKNAWLQGMLDATSKPKDEGRSRPVKMENLRGEKPGFVMAEGTNWWSVDEKDDYWQTKEGHKEAMSLYGQKPSWVKESSLEYNPRTGKYDPIKKEKFVEIKPKTRISL